jgi:MSHA pilin protein MshC
MKSTVPKSPPTIAGKPVHRNQWPSRSAVPLAIASGRRVDWRVQNGATLIEIIAVLVILGIVTAVLVSHVSDVSQYQTQVAADILKEHIRYTQLNAMQYGAIFGIKNSGGHYWMFLGTNPELAINRRYFPGENGITVDIGSTDPFTLFFDAYGRPYTAYVSAATNSPLTATQNITVGAKTLQVHAKTGYLQ